MVADFPATQRGAGGYGSTGRADVLQRAPRLTRCPSKSLQQGAGKTASACGDLSLQWLYRAGPWWDWPCDSYRRRRIPCATFPVFPHWSPAVSPPPCWLPARPTRSRRPPIPAIRARAAPFLRTPPRARNTAASSTSSTCPQAPRRSGEHTNILGAVVGGLAGAAIGSQIGGGTGRTAATVLGGVAGAAIGSQMRATRA